MKHSRYKYFKNIDHARQFLEGNVFHQTLACFRDYEDAEANPIIGDEFESTRLYRPADGLQVNSIMRGSFPLQMGFEPSARAAEIYVFCMSLWLTDELVREFKATAVVEIFNPAAFITCWLNALPHGAQHFARKVDYYRQEYAPGNVWPQPHLIATAKRARFSHQQEYRLGFSTTGALDFEQVTTELRDRKGRPDPKPEEHHNLTLQLGDLRDICHFRELSTRES